MRRVRHQRKRVPQIWVLAVLLVGAALRITLLTDARFHADEALFATLGRLIVSGQDPFLSETTLLVDKPPLFYYNLALTLSICWGCEMTARLVGLFSGIITIAMTARLTRALTSDKTAPAIVAMLVAISPMAILFSVTVFADPLMLVWLLAALVLAVEGRPGWSGLCFGCALASKQNAIFVLPLILWLLAVSFQHGGKTPVVYIGRFVLGALSLVMAGLMWDLARSPDVGFLISGFARNNPGRLIRSSEILPRLRAWWLVIRAFAPGFVSTFVFIFAGLSWPFHVVRNRVRDRSTVVALALSVFIITYFGLHWLVAFPLFDRYMLLIVPLLAVLAGSSIARWFSAVPGSRLLASTSIALLIAFLLSPALSDYPVGGDHGANDGIDQVAEILKTQPDGSIVYHRSLGWLLSYYLFDAYVVPVTVDSPAALTADLTAFADDPSERFIVLTSMDGENEMKRAILAAGFSYDLLLTTTNRQGQPTFEVLRLTK